MLGKVKVSVVYVNYKSFNELRKSITSIAKSKTKVKYEIIVVDNEGNSKLKNHLKFEKGIKYIKSPKNLGYSAGNNLGAKYAKGKYLLILNPDTELKSGVIDKLVQFLDKNTNSAIVAPILVDIKGKILFQISSKRLTPLIYIYTYTIAAKIFPDNSIKKEFLKENINSKKPYEVDVIPGSAFMIRKSIFDKIGGFDEKFFLYFEDNDICDRVRKAGYKIYKIPGARVFHDWRPADGSKVLKDIFEKSRFYYFKKHFGIVSAIIVEALSRSWK